MSHESFDLVVIGGGPGGYVAAVRASQLGLKTAIVEHAHMGGICLNWGCIPTKTLLRSAEILDVMRHADRFGLACDNPRFDLQSIIKRSRHVADKLASGVQHLMKKNNIVVIKGSGQLAGQGLVTVKTEQSQRMLAAPHVILATGARARSLPDIPIDGERIWSYKEAMTPRFLPRRLLVIGSGAIGIEFASFYCALGTKVTVVEIQDSILPAEDKEIASLARKAFEKRDITIITGAQLSSLVKDGKGLQARVLVDGKTENLEFDCAIVAIGIIGNVEDLGLKGTHVGVKNGHVLIDEWLRTGEAGVYAIGDLTGPPWLAHKASHEGIICVEKILGLGSVRPLNRSLIPGCTYSDPQIASIGLNEVEARAQAGEIRVGRFPFLANGKAIALGAESEGLIKTIFNAKTGELLGAHMIGSEVTELIQGYAIAMTLETTESELMHTVFPHPTLSEMMHESVLEAYNRAIHI